MLTHQGSNLNSSGPKPDVLPITPWVNHWRLFSKDRAKIEIFLILKHTKQFFSRGTNSNFNYWSISFFLKPYICPCSKKINHAEDKIN